MADEITPVENGHCNASTPLIERERNSRHTCHFGAVYRQDSNGGTVTLSLPSRERSHDSLLFDRGRARTVSSLAPLPESCYTINTFLFFLTCFQLMNLLTLTYTDSVINYIAKRFHIPNTMASFIPSAYQIGNMIVIIPISYYGSNFNRPKAIAVGVIVMIVGLGFCVLPHFILPAPKVPNHTPSDVCNKLAATSSDDLLHFDRSTMLTLPDNLPCNANGTVYNPALLLIIGHALFGAGAAPLWPLGVSYIDDHVVLRKVPIYLGIFIGTTLTGPVFGFLLGSVSSAIYVNLQGKQLSQSNPGYIGAWWLGYLIACIIMILLLFPFYFYPRSLPISQQKQAEVIEIEELYHRRQMSRTQSMLQDTQGGVIEADQSDISSNAGCSAAAEQLQNCDEKSSACGIIWRKLSDLICEIKKIIMTPLIPTAIIAYTAMANLLAGVATFGSSYVQMIFSVFRTTSDMLIGGLCIPMGITGTLVGGYLMKKYNFDIRTTLKFVLVMSSTGCVVLACLFPCGCEAQKVAGLTVPYNDSNKPFLVDHCNSDCFCPKGQFELICGVDQTTYVSPCYAGCLSETRKKETVFKESVTYHNCSCVGNAEREATKGPCTTTHCTAVLAVFIVLAGLGVMFFLCLCQAPVYVVLLRMLQLENKSLGIGLMSFVSRLLGSIPGPIWYGMILDRSCIYWTPDCLGKSTCLLYNTLGLRYSFIGLTFSWACMYVAVFIISFVWMEKHPDHYEKSVQPLKPADSSSSSEDDQEQDDRISRFWK